MSDPTFKTRAELEAWAAGKARVCATKAQMLSVIKTVQRVTLAHKHLLGDN